MEFKKLNLRKNPECVICGPNPTITELIDYEEFCGVAAFGDEMLLSPDDVISVQQFDQLRRNAESHILLDVREPHEREISSIGGSILIPKAQIDKMNRDLNKEDLIIIYCKAGIRSAEVLIKLRQKGFANLKNLAGGINAWAKEIDNSIPTY